MSPTRVPWHRSLFVRVFGLGAVIAVLAVAAATWATVHATSVAVREEQRESLHSDARTYEALLGYAATHHSWSGAADLVARLARERGAPVTLTDTTGRVLVSSTTAPAGLSPAGARARIDPLDVDTTLVGSAGASGSADAVSSTEPAPAVGQSPADGRCVGEILPSECRALLVVPTLALDRRVTGPFDAAAGQTALDDLRRRTDSCLTGQGLPRLLTVRSDLTAIARTAGHRDRVAACLDTALRTVLAPYVAPPALLHLGGGGTQAQVLWDLSGRNQARIGLLAGGVLVTTLALSALLAASIVRPLRRMSAAAERAGEGDLDARVPTGRRDEVGQVGRAFNTMAERRQELEAARQRMVSDVSHELRTPLANVRGWLEAAQDDLVTLDERLLASLHEETLHLQHLVDDLHDLSVADAGELRLEPVPVDLAVFLDQVATAFGGAAEAAGVRLDATCAPDSTVLADPVRLRQAVGNLLANALRHTPPGGRITLTGRPGAIEVADTGEGIAPQELPHVFERFRRVDPSRSRATGGSGLGLAIVRQIAEGHGGTVSAASTPGAGTVVTLDLAPSADR